MPVPNLIFDPPYDIHLIRGQAIDLRPLLRIGNQDAAAYLGAHATAQLTFSATYKGTSLPANLYSGFDIVLITSGPAGGLLNTNTPAPADEIRNFLVIATVTDSSDASTKDTAIRIHIHNSIKEAWLSPSILTVQKGINGFRCSVRARFNDDVEAEIAELYRGNNGGPINYTVNPPLVLTWASPTANLISGTGEVTPGAAIATGLHNVTTLIMCTGINLAFGGAATVTAAGQIFVADQLSGTRNDITASLVATGDCPGFAKINEVPNVLFIPDGFNQQDASAFDVIVDKYISELTSGKISSPFDILKGSINFWKVFITSGDRGATNKCEIYMIEQSGNVKAHAMYQPVKPVGSFTAPGSWGFTQILYKIGMPVRADKSKTNSNLRNEWKAKTALSSGDIDSIPNEAIDNWKRLAERRLPEERDTALGITINDYSAAANDGDHNMINFSQKRMTRARLNTFLATLRDNNGNLIGDKFIQTGPNPGKDSDTIVFVSAAANGRALNFTGGFFTLIRSDIEWHNISGTINDFKRSLDVNNSDIDDLPLSEKGTLTHELGHSFALEDEYGEYPPDQAWAGKFINDPQVTGWNFTAFSNPPSLADWSGNIQARQDLLSPNPNVPGTGMLDANKLKWRYHRIKKCGVLTANPVQNGNNYNLTLRSGQAGVFTAGDKVFMRKRRGEEFTLTNRANNNFAPITTSSVAPNTLIGTNLTVTAITAATDQVQATDAASNNYTFTVRRGWSGNFSVSDVLIVTKNFRAESIASITRTTSPNPATTSDTIAYAVSNELEVVSVNSGANQVVVKSTDSGITLSNEYINAEPGTRMILYNPVPAPGSVASSSYKYAEIISKKVLDHLAANPFPFNAVADSAHGNALTEIIDVNPVQNSSIPGSLVPCCSSRKKQIVALYSCGQRFHGNMYHPTAQCFMRSHTHDGSYDEFCAVCKYILVDMIDPSKHGQLDEFYGGRKIYPD